MFRFFYSCVDTGPNLYDILADYRLEYKTLHTKGKNQSFLP